MTLRGRWSTSLISALWLALAFTVWAVFAPIPMGGTTAYIIVNGISMEPKFHLGDLVIARSLSQYNVGDAVVYRNQGMGGKNVFHRIIELNLDHYVLKGDNNSWVDTYQPAREEIIGKLWIHIPRGGKVLEKVRTPIGMALSAGVLGLLLVTGFFPGRREGGNQMNHSAIWEWLRSIGRRLASFFAKKPVAPLQNQPHGNPSIDSGISLDILFFTLGIIAFSSLILAIVSYTRPAFRTVTENIKYQHLGVFSYSATAPQGVYDANSIKSGDPIFPQLTCKVDVNFNYMLIAEQLTEVKGTYQPAAIITDPLSGWKRTVPLQEEMPFDEVPLTVNAKLDLCKIEAMIQSFEENSSARPGVYELTISPRISISADVKGIKLEDEFDKGLIFRYDRTQFHIIGDVENDPFNPTESGALGRKRVEADTLSLLGLKLQIPILRVSSLIGLAASMAGMLLLWQKLYQLSQNNQAEFIHVKFGTILVDVQKTKLGSSKSLIDVSSIDDLAKLAERHNTTMLHETQGSLHIYYVQTEISIYRFVLLPENPTPTDVV